MFTPLMKDNIQGSLEQIVAICNRILGDEWPKGLSASFVRTRASAYVSSAQRKIENFDDYCVEDAVWFILGPCKLNPAQWDRMAIMQGTSLYIDDVAYPREPKSAPKLAANAVSDFDPFKAVLGVEQ